MLKRLKMPALFGLSFYGISYGVVKFMGFSSNSFTFLAYLYIILGLVIGLYYEVDSFGGISGFLDNIVVVIEGEELKLRKIISGEKYRLNGEIEKIK